MILRQLRQLMCLIQILRQFRMIQRCGAKAPLRAMSMLTAFCLSAFFISGCSGGNEQRKPIVKKEKTSGAEVKPSAPKPVAAKPVTNVSIDKNAPIRVCALLERHGKPKVGLIDKSTGRGFIIGKGESFAGYELVNVDYKNESALFLKDGHKVVLELTAGAVTNASSAATSAETAKSGPGYAGHSPSGIDLLNAPSQKFKPTPKEISAGIDPNDPGTWPQGYKGPTIERLLQQHPEMAAPKGPKLGPQPGNERPAESEGR